MMIDDQPDGAAARDIGKLVDLAHADGWDSCVIASPDGRRFIDPPALEAKTGHTVRSTNPEPETGTSTASLGKWPGAQQSITRGFEIELSSRLDSALFADTPRP